MTQASAALSMFDQIFFVNFSQPQGSHRLTTACPFSHFFHLQKGRNISERNPDPSFYPYAIYSFIYWPSYIQFLNVTCEPRLISARPFVHFLSFIKAGKSYPAHVAGQVKIMRQ